MENIEITEYQKGDSSKKEEYAVRFENIESHPKKNLMHSFCSDYSLVHVNTLRK